MKDYISGISIIKGMFRATCFMMSVMLGFMMQENDIPTWLYILVTAIISSSAIIGWYEDN